MTFFFDHNVSPKIAQILRILKKDIKTCSEDFKPEVEDEEWLRTIASKGWIFVTLDHRIRHRGPERLVLQQTGVRGVWLPSQASHWSQWKIAQWFLNHWQTVEETVGQNPSVTLWKVTIEGKVQPFPLVSEHPTDS